MIKIRFSMKRKVDVRKGLAKNWQKAFPDADIYLPEGWESSLSISNRMWSFSFARVANAKIREDEYIIVIKKALSRTATGVDTSGEERWFICPVMAILRPYPEEVGSGLGRIMVEDYLKAIAVATFTESEKEAWKKEGKLRIS